MLIRWSALAILRGASIVLLCASTFLARNEQADQPPLIRKIFVDTLGQNRGAREIRSRLVRRLERSHEIQVVTDPHKADATLKGTGQMWSVGEISLSTRSHSANEHIFEGYLSVEIVGNEGQTLWSYLATPSKFPWGGIADDLAKQVAGKLLEGVRRGEERSDPSTSAAIANIPVTFKAAGSTFSAPLYHKWFQSFQEDHPSVRITYEAVGSAEGIREVGAGEVDFGASDMPVSDLQHRFIQIPTNLGAVVPIYNLTHPSERLNFTPRILAGIYLGKITKWNDPQIKAVNSKAALPNAEIIVVHRSDGSGTTFVWTDYLSKVSTQWKTSVGANVKVPWPVGIGAAYNDGVASAVQHAPNSIGYVELIYALQHELQFGAVRNAAGQFIKADLASVTAASRVDNNSLQASITDAPGRTAYPIASYTWLLLPALDGDKSKRAILLDLVRWMLSSGQKSCSALGYAPLAPQVAKAAIESAEKVLDQPAQF